MGDHGMHALSWHAINKLDLDLVYIVIDKSK